MDDGQRQLDQSGEPASEKDAYDIFILVVTMLSLAGLMILALPFIDQSIKSIVYVLDFGLSIILLGDFLRSLIHAPDRRAYLLRWGWLDLLGSIPAMVIALPIWRLARLARIGRIFYRMRIKDLPRRLEEHRRESLLWIVVLVAVIFVWLSSTVILTVEQTDPDANIRTSGDALWWAIVTFATVGYGDKVPVTLGGRLFAGVLMFLGIGLYSVLTSYITVGLFARGAVATQKDINNIAGRLERIEKLLEQENEGHEMIQSNEKRKV